MQKVSQNGVVGNQHRDQDIILESPRGDSPWLDGDLRGLPASREGQRLVRCPDWCTDEGPYMLVATGNSRVLKPAVSLARAEAYLRDLGMREFDVQMCLYHGELWARRRGSVKPIYPLREGDKPLMFDVLTELEVGTPTTRTSGTYGTAVTSV
jgi:hypothetical protein